MSSEKHNCLTHKEAKSIFCEENRVLPYQLCSDSQEHKGHRHCPTEAASEGQIFKLLMQIASLWKKVKENQKNLEAEKRMTTQWMDYVILWKEMIKTEYGKFHTVLCGEEEQHIECMENEGQALLEKLWKGDALMAQKRSQLIEMYWELKTMSQEAYAVLLQPLKPDLGALPMTGLTERSNCYHEKPVGRFGVLLDCEGRCVSFLDVAKSSLIFSYPLGTFNYPVRPFFSPLAAHVHRML
nr:tripartite motif-containing protein 43A-like [Meriones unguiculatus]